MSLKPITFKKACKIVQKSLAAILDGNALTYPVINEDYDGHDCIEANYNDEDGANENVFNRADEYYINDKGCLVIHKCNGYEYRINDKGCRVIHKCKGHEYILQFLEIVKVK